MAKIKKFEDIESWKQARSLTKKIYEVTAAGKFAPTLALRIKYGALPFRFFQISLKVLNAEVTKNSSSFLLSRRDLAAKRALNSTSHSTRSTFQLLSSKR